MGQIERIYEWIDSPITPETRQAMITWSEQNRSGTHGSHRYTPEQFGLSADTLRDEFSFYTDRFAVNLER